MHARLAAASAWTVHGPDVRLDAPELPPGMHPAPEPPRPDAVNPAAWRRMSRVARLACTAAAPVLADRADRARLPLFWATTYGEFSSTFAFLQSYFTKGAAGASPLAFQNAVHNAPAGHLSIAFGLRGPSETLCGGHLGGLRAVERAVAWVQLRREPVLVVVADELGPWIQKGLELASAEGAFGEGAAALILEPGEGLTVHDAPPPDGAWQRGQRFPFEPPFRPEGRAHDRVLGLSGVVDAVALVGLLRAGGGAVGWSGPGGPLWVSV